MFTARSSVIATPVLAIAFALCCAAPARAQWMVNAKGPDVFGNTTVVAAAMAGSGDGIVVQCDQDNLYISR